MLALTTNLKTSSTKRIAREVFLILCKEAIFTLGTDNDHTVSRAAKLTYYKYI